MMMRAAAILLLCACASLAHGAMSSANFIVPSQVVGSGGAPTASANFLTTGTVGQDTIGPSSSANYSNGAGFWYASGSVIVFSFTAQTNVAPSTTVTSNTVTMSGLVGPEAISITGGTYSINGGAFTSAAGNVNNGDAIVVQFVSSASYLTTTTATLTIGGVSEDFDVTTWSAAVFSFTPQASAPLSTAVSSNTVTMAGLSGPEPVSITAGTYSLNGGAFTSSAGSVNNGDTIVVRVTSAATYATTTSATLNIGGVGEAFSVTTLAAPLTVSGPSVGTIGGTITATLNPGAGQPATCGFAPGAQFIPLEGSAGSPPANSSPHGLVFPYGLFDFSIVGCNPASTVTITLSYPGGFPPNTQYWKYGPTPTQNSPHWYTIPATFSGTTATITLVDGGLGDDDLHADGNIDDQGGPAFMSGPIPSLSPWALLLLSLVVGWLGSRAAGRVRHD
jgi:hypothetical protein